MSNPLLRLLSEDNIEIESDGREFVWVKCWNPHHRNPTGLSMRLSTITGLYECSVCHAQGSALDYLIENRAQDPDEAELELRRLGWTRDRIALAHVQRVGTMCKRLGYPRFFPEIPELIDSHPVLSRHDYRREDGTTWAVRLHAILPSAQKARPPKQTVRDFTRGSVAGMDGWFMAPPTSRALPPEARCNSELAPLYKLPELVEASPSRRVWVLEDEEAVDLVQGGQNPPAATCLYFPIADNLTDLRPLKGRKVLVVAAAEPKSAATAGALGRVLQRIARSVEIARPAPPAGTAPPIGIKGALGVGGVQGARDWLRDVVGIEKLDQRDIILERDADPMAVLRTLLGTTLPIDGEPFAARRDARASTYQLIMRAADQGERPDVRREAVSLCRQRGIGVPPGQQYILMCAWHERFMRPLQSVYPPDMCAPRRVTKLLRNLDPPYTHQRKQLWWGRGSSKRREAVPLSVAFLREHRNAITGPPPKRKEEETT